MATEAQLKQALINADKAGDVEAATKLAMALKSGRYNQAQDVTNEQQIPQKEQNVPQEQGFFDAAIDSGRFIAQSGIQNIVSGYAGLIELAKTGGDVEAASAEISKQQGLLRPGEIGDRSKAQLEDVGGAVQSAVDVVNYPISGLAGAAEIVTGQGVEQASQTIGNIQDNGLGVTFGDRVLEETGNPLLATAAYAFPDLAMEVIGMKGAGGAAKSGMTASEAALKTQALQQKIKTSVNKSFGESTGVGGVDFFDKDGLISEEALQVLDDIESGSITPPKKDLELEPLEGVPPKTIPDNGTPIEPVDDIQADIAPVESSDGEFKWGGSAKVEETKSLNQSERLNQDIASQLEKDGVLTKEQAERFNLFKSRGVDPIRSQVTQRGDDFIISQELAKGTNEISEILASQDEALTNAARAGVENMGATTSDILETNANIYQTIDNVVGAHERSVQEAYRQAREINPTKPTTDRYGQKSETNKIINPQGMLDTLKANRGKEKATGGLIDSVFTDLRKKGVIDSKGELVENIDVQTAEKIRQDINSHFEDATGQGKMVIRELKDSLDLDVEDAVGGDFFADARAAKIELERIKRKEKKNVRDRSKGTLLTDILDNKIPEEKITQKILTARDDEFLHIVDFLTNEAGDQGIQALQNLKAQVLTDAIESAISTRAKTEGGGHAFNGNRFNKKFEGMRKSKKYNALFNPSERKLIEDIAEIDFLRTPKTGTYMGKGASAPIIEELRGEITEMSRTQEMVLKAINMGTLGLTGKVGLNAQALTKSAKRKAQRKSKKATESQIKKQINPTKETKKAVKKQSK